MTDATNKNGNRPGFLAPPVSNKPQSNGGGNGSLVDGLEVKVLAIDTAKQVVTCCPVDDDSLVFTVEVRKEKRERPRQDKVDWEGNHIDAGFATAFAPTKNGPQTALLERLIIGAKPENATPAARRAALKTFLKARKENDKPLVVDWIHNAPGDKSKVRTGILTIDGYYDKDEAKTVESSVIVWNERAISAKDAAAMEALGKHIDAVNGPQDVARNERAAGQGEKSPVKGSVAITVRAVKNGEVVGIVPVFKWNREAKRLPSGADVQALLEYAQTCYPDTDLEVLSGTAYPTTKQSIAKGLGTKTFGLSDRAQFFVLAQVKDTRPEGESQYGHCAVPGTITLSPGQFNSKTREIDGAENEYVTAAFIGAKGAELVTLVEGPKGEVYKLASHLVVEDRREKRETSSAQQSAGKEQSKPASAEDPFSGLEDAAAAGPR